MSTIYVKERNDPVVVVWITKLNPDKTYSPYDFTGSTVEFYQKDDPTGSDGAAIYTTASGITLEPGPPWDKDGKQIVDRTERNRLSIQMTSTNLSSPDNKFYRIDAVKNDRRETVLKGLLVIENA